MKPLVSRAALDLETIRADFPILHRRSASGAPLIYLDSAATSQKPRQVIDAMSAFYQQHNANIHRGIHTLAEEATAAYEDARQQVAAFIGAPSWRQVIFTRNTTESINLVAQSWGRSNLQPGDLVLLTEMEHHSNLVPWQMLAQTIGIQIEYIPLTEDYRLDLAAYERLLEKKPKLVAFMHVSNVLGTVNPAQEICSRAHAAGALVLLDAAQSVPHMAVDVGAINADFVAFSAHKMLGPTGIGVLYGRRELLEEMPPFLGGGDMIKRVRFDGFVANDLPYKFEAGTPAIAEAVGLGAAVAYLQHLGMEAVFAHEQALSHYALERLSEVPGLKLIGPQGADHAGVASFLLANVHPHDVAQMLDASGVAVRAGHHCAMPLHERLCLPATTRASFYVYNQPQDIDSLIEGLYRVKELFG